MRKILFTLISILLVAGLWSCSDDDNDSKSVSFRRAYYVLPSSEPLKVEVRLSEPAQETLTIPFEVSGTAEEDTEFSLSAHEFTVEAGKDTAFVEIMPLNNMKPNREIKLALHAPAGYHTGLYAQTIIPIEIKTAFTSYFFLTDFDLYKETNLGVQLFVGSKEYKYPSYDIHVPFEIDPASTAVPGVHFEVVGGKNEFVYQKDDFLGRAKIKFLKKEKGKDLLVLRLVENDNFYVGLQNDRAYIHIDGPINFENLKGEWKFKDFVSKEYIESTSKMGGFNDNLEKLPQNSANDILIFETSGGKNIVNTSKLSGDLKNYFSHGAEVVADGIISDQIYTGDGSGEWSVLREVLKTTFSEVNLSFSADHVNKSKAEVDFRLMDDGNELEVRIVEYIPTDFLQDTYQFYNNPDCTAGDMYFNPELPMKGKFTLSFRFTRIK